MEAMEGRTYGPFSLRVCAAKVADFVAVTSDVADRWQEAAPPGWAAVALFVVAPGLLADPDLGAGGSSVIHGDQRFEWFRPVPIESVVNVTGTVTRVRERGGVFFTTFEFEAGDAAGALVTGSSTFLMSGSGPPGAGTTTIEQPSPASRGENDSLAAQGDGFPRLRRSAARSDLVRYAGATGDWNPIHWDHQSAVTAGLPTVVVHGLMQAAWLLSSGSVLSDHPAPIAQARFRFRAPLIAGTEAVVTGDLKGSEAAARLAVGDNEIVSASMTLR